MTKPYHGEELVQAASALAERLHEGQEHFFGDGSYYDMHVHPVATIVRRLGYGAAYIAAAYLHDSIEDTGVTYDGLLREGMPPKVAWAVGLMAKRDGQTHEDYLDRVLASHLSIVGKFADSSFNYSWTMLNSPGISDRDFRDWGLEYAHNIAVLRPRLPAPQA